MPSGVLIRFNLYLFYLDFSWTFWVLFVLFSRRHSAGDFWGAAHSSARSAQVRAMRDVAEVVGCRSNGQRPARPLRRHCSKQAGGSAHCCLRLAPRELRPARASGQAAHATARGEQQPTPGPSRKGRKQADRSAAGKCTWLLFLFSLCLFFLQYVACLFINISSNMV